MIIKNYRREFKSLEMTDWRLIPAKLENNLILKLSLKILNSKNGLKILKIHKGNIIIKIVKCKSKNKIQFRQKIDFTLVINLNINNLIIINLPLIFIFKY